MCFCFKGIKRLLRSIPNEDAVYFSSDLEVNDRSNSSVIQAFNRVDIISLKSYAKYSCKKTLSFPASHFKS